MNIRQKGQDGEREICKALNSVYAGVCADLALDPYPTLPFQRNQLQTAVGGSDIANPFGLCIEVKRQEALSVETWWKQCQKSAEKEGGLPILIYRQNRKSWKVMMDVNVVTAMKDCDLKCRAEISYVDFLEWLYIHLLGCLLQNS